MRDVFYFETRITCRAKLFCLSHFRGNSIPKVGQQTVPPLCIYLCGFVEGHFVQFKRESREKIMMHSLANHLASFYWALTVCSELRWGEHVWATLFYYVLLWLPTWPLFSDQWNPGMVRSPRPWTQGGKTVNYKPTCSSNPWHFSSFGKHCQKIENSAKKIEKWGSAQPQGN